MPLSEELLPCPFCGARLERSEAFSNRLADCFVHPAPEVISYEVCPVGDFRLYGNNPDRIAAWNTRAEERAKAQALVERLRAGLEACEAFLDDGHAIKPTEDRYRLVERIRAILAETEGGDP